jgi:hypothetical protein
MSIEFVSVEPIIFDTLKNFDFDGVSVHSIEDENAVVLTDGTNYLWAEVTPDVLFGRLDENGDFKTESKDMNGVVFTRYGGNNPGKIIQAIEECFETKLISEHDPDFEKYITCD